MTTIDLDTSPLEAAREWRGIGIVAAAMACGLPVAQAEALEEGDPSAFASIDEMIAAAVVYGASLGIGRDEAMALLDRTVRRTGAEVHLPAAVPVAAAAGFSEAVQERSARIAGREAVATEPLLPADAALEAEAASVLDEEDEDDVVVEPVTPEAALPQVPLGPTPEQAVAASGEIHIEDEFGPEAPWERSGFTSELEAWAEDLREDEEARAVVAVERPRSATGARVAEATRAGLERIVGTERADAAVEWTARTSDRVREATRDARERLGRSEHATLFVAIGGGAVLIALLVALGGAMGGGEDPAPTAADRPAATTTPATTEGAAQESAATPAPAAAGPMVPPARITLDVFNAGSKKGYAKEVAARLEGLGYRVDTVTNAKSDYAGATIIHPVNLAREAKLIARRTGIGTLQEAPGTTRKITVVVT